MTKKNSSSVLATKEDCPTDGKIPEGNAAFWCCCCCCCSLCMTPDAKKKPSYYYYTTAPFAMVRGSKRTVNAFVRPTSLPPLLQNHNHHQQTNRCCCRTATDRSHQPITGRFRSTVHLQRRRDGRPTDFPPIRKKHTRHTKKVDTTRKQTAGREMSFSYTGS